MDLSLSAVTLTNLTTSSNDSIILIKSSAILVYALATSFLFVQYGERRIDGVT